MLIILAGVTINLTLEDNGIFNKANTAKEQTQLSNAEDIIKLTVLENKVKSISGDADTLTNEELKKEIEKKLTEQGYTVSEGIVTYYKDKTIDIENYLEKENTATTYTAYNVGDHVTVCGEKFYVIKASSANEEKVILLAEKNIDTTTLKQSDSAGIVAFSNTDYWSSIEGITYPYNLNGVETSASTYVMNIAKAYGTAKGGEGRLMTIEEIVALGGSIDKYSSESCPSWINTSNFWLGSAFNGNSVWRVGTKFGQLFGTDCRDEGSYGVRPVIEISKSLI